MNDFLIPAIIVLLLWYLFDRWANKKASSLPSANIKEIECKNQYDKLKTAILQCKSLHVLAMISDDIDEFYMIFYNQVEKDRLTNYLRDLDVSVMQKKHKLDDQNSYA